MRRYFVVLGALAAVGLGSVALSPLVGSNAANGTDEEGQARAAANVEQARKRSQAPALPESDPASTDPSLRLMGPSLAAEAAEVARDIPTPDDSSFDWSRWEGSISPEGVQRVEEMYAACAWYRLRLAGTQRADEAGSVTTATASWPFIRTLPAAKAAKANDAGDLKQFVDTNC